MPRTDGPGTTYDHCNPFTQGRSTLVSNDLVTPRASLFRANLIEPDRRNANPGRHAPEAAGERSEVRRQQQHLQRDLGVARQADRRDANADRRLAATVRSEGAAD